MYYYLSNALKRRILLELRDSFSEHPLYSKIVPFIQNKFSFTERPQYGIVLKGASGNKVQLSADNFVGTVESHVMLMPVGPPSYPLEWVREDLSVVQHNQGRMPIAPGIYYLEVLSVPSTIGGDGTFILDPLLTASAELVLRFNSGLEREAQLQQVPVEGMLRLWRNNRLQLKEGADYTVDYSTGALTLLGAFGPNDTLYADYRYAAPSIGPIPFRWNQSDTTTLPGVVMAFGKRARVSDKVAIVVYGDRVATANAYGGRNEFSFDLDVISRDVETSEEIADFAVMSLWGQKRPYLSSEGLELLDVSMGGEAEEVYDETADLMYYTSSLSVQVQADWEIHVPLPFTLSRTSTSSAEGERKEKGSPDLLRPFHVSGLYSASLPILPGRNFQYEKIT